MKARDLRKAKAMTGNKSIKQDLSQLELRVIGLVSLLGLISDPIIYRKYP